MAFFPASPTNGQQANVGNIVYQWNATSNVWNRVGTTVVQLVDGALVTITGNLLVTGAGASQFTGNLISLSNIVSSSSVVAVSGVYSGNVNSGNVNATGNILATGNLVSPNLYTTRIYGNGPWSTTGTVTSSSFLGATVSVTGNITTDTNLNVNNSIAVGGIANVSGAVNAGSFTAVGAITGASLSVSGGITGGNISGGNLIVSSNVSASGNVAGTYILGNGALLTGVVTGGGGAGNRANATVFTGSLANAATFTGNISLAKGYAVYKVTTTDAAWVRLYANAATQTADSTRLITNDPQPGAGVMVETISTGANIVLVSPGTIGWNDNPASNIIPISVTNLANASANIGVTITYLGLEI
jgi:hypothetical protein